MDEETPDCPEIFSVAERIPHPDYNTISKINDIGLVKLDREVTYNSIIRPACLPDSSNIPTWLIGTGFKGTDFKQEILIKLSMEKLVESMCKDLKNNQICAESYFGNCIGTTGGSLEMIHSEYYKMTKIYGVMNIPTICVNNSSKPGIFIKVFPYISWIENIVWWINKLKLKLKEFV